MFISFFNFCIDFVEVKIEIVKIGIFVFYVLILFYWELREKISGGCEIE